MNKQLILGLSATLALSGCLGGGNDKEEDSAPLPAEPVNNLPVTPPVSADNDIRFTDTDNDGVQDSEDNCPASNAAYSVDKQGCFQSLRIEAEDYVEAYDLTEGNAGETYRDGDADIYRARDIDGGHAVGNSEPTEWQRYDITLPGGFVEIHARIASAEGTGGYSIYLDDQLITSETITRSLGDDYSWRTRRLGKFELEAGEHSLQIVTDEAGLRMNWLEFVAAGPTVSCDDGKPEEGVFECEVTPMTTSIDNQDRVLYEMNFSTVGRDGALAKVVERLDHLASLQVNTLWLMPVHPRGGNTEASFEVSYLLPEREYSMSPYAASDYLSIDANLGDLNDLRILINEAHKRGITVVLDWVANHTSWNHPWLLNKDWYTQVDGIVVQPQEQPWYDVADLNYDNLAMRAAMIDAMLFWLDQGIDGFRCDYADGVPNDFWQDVISQIRDVKPDALMLAEGREFHLDLGFDLTYSWDANTSVKHAIEEGNANLVLDQQAQINANNLPDNTHLLRYSTNHDLTAWEENPMQIACVQINDDCAAYSELTQHGALAQFALHLFYGDVPLIYSGQEVGADGNTSFYYDHLIDWTQNADILAQYQSMMSLFASSDLIKQGREKSYADDTVVAFQKVHDEQRMVMLTNMLASDNTYQVPDDLQGDYVNALTGADVSLQDTYTLAAYDFVVLTQDYVATGPAYGDTQLYLRGDFNGWSLDNSMIYVGNYTYMAAANIENAGNYYFKFANAGWDFRIGAEGAASLDQPMNYGILTDAYDPAQTLQVNDTGWYVFTLEVQDPAQPVLTVTKEDPTYPGETLYVRGFDGIWDTSRPMTYFGAGYYAYDVLATQNPDLSYSKYFKIASESWANPNSGGAVVTLNGDYVPVQQVDDAITLALESETQLRIIYHAIDDQTHAGEVTVMSLATP